MPKPCRFKSVFKKALDRLSEDDLKLALKALEAIESYHQTGQASYGLRIKKLYSSDIAKTYEARISIDLRIVWVETKEEIIFALLGNHDDIRRFIKGL